MVDDGLIVLSALFQGLPHELYKMNSILPNDLPNSRSFFDVALKMYWHEKKVWYETNRHDWRLAVKDDWFE
jgi:hypothetical protein